MMFWKKKKPRKFSLTEFERKQGRMESFIKAERFTPEGSAWFFCLDPNLTADLTQEEIFFFPERKLNHLAPLATLCLNELLSGHNQSQPKTV